MKKYLLILVLVISGSSKLQAQVLLYENQFENPLSAPFLNCGPDLDANTINSLAQAQAQEGVAILYR